MELSRPDEDSMKILRKNDLLVTVSVKTILYNLEENWTESLRMSVWVCGQYREII